MDLDETWQVGLRPEKTKPCTFPAKSRYGFWREREKWVAEALFFCHVYTTHHFCHFPWIDFRQTFHEHLSRWRLGHMVSYSRKVSINGSNLPKTLFLGYPICDQATGHRKRSVTPTLFPSPGGHPTDEPVPR